MGTASKVLSVRCDMHPPMTASLYCEFCKKFLCKICAEVKVGGRVCASCKRPVKQPTPDEFSDLIEERRRAIEDARLAKEAEGRIKAQLEKAKVDRETKLKAEFAARKAQWAHEEATKQVEPVASRTSGGVALPRATGGVALPRATGGTALVERPTTPIPGRSDMDVRAAISTDDGLGKLKEHAHVNVINKARNWMLGIGILTILLNGGLLLFISDEEAQMVRKSDEARAEIIESITAELKTVKSSKRRDELTAKRAMVEAGGGMTQAVGRGIFFIVKLVFGFYLAVGAVLVGLYFIADSYPRAATTTGFLIYLLASLSDLIMTLAFGGGFLWMIVRWMALVALYNGMQAGNELYRLRKESGEYA